MRDERLVWVPRLVAAAALLAYCAYTYHAFRVTAAALEALERGHGFAAAWGFDAIIATYPGSICSGLSALLLLLNDAEHVVSPARIFHGFASIGYLLLAVSALLVAHSRDVAGIAGRRVDAPEWKRATAAVVTGLVIAVLVEQLSVPAATAGMFGLGVVAGAAIVGRRSARLLLDASPYLAESVTTIVPSEEWSGPPPIPRSIPEPIPEPVPSFAARLPTPAVLLFTSSAVVVGGLMIAATSTDAPTKCSEEAADCAADELCSDQACVPRAPVESLVRDTVRKYYAHLNERDVGGALGQWRSPNRERFARVIRRVEWFEVIAVDVQVLRSSEAVVRVDVAGKARDREAERYIGTMHLVREEEQWLIEAIDVPAVAPAEWTAEQVRIFARHEIAKIEHLSLAQLPPETLRQTYNKVAALYGYEFRSGGEMEAHFRATWWYAPRGFQFDELSEDEKALVARIKKAGQRH